MFVVARTLGMSAAQVLRDVSHAELVSWAAFFAVEKAVTDLHAKGHR